MFSEVNIGDDLLEIDLNELINSSKIIEANKSLINNISIDLNNITQQDIDSSKDTLNFLLNISFITIFFFSF